MKRANRFFSKAAWTLVICMVLSLMLCSCGSDATETTLPPEAVYGQILECE